MDRRTLIADATITLLGSDGARALTHRAVDTQAGLPMGSTSFYCRTRLDLLTLALTRHAALDLADVQADGTRLAGRDISPQTMVDLLAYRVADWLSPDKRSRLVARFELFLMASREPALAAIVSQRRDFFLQTITAGLMRAGVDAPAEVAPRLLVVMEGLLLDQVRAPDGALSGEQQRALFQAVLKS